MKQTDTQHSCTDNSLRLVGHFAGIRVFAVGLILGLGLSSAWAQELDTDYLPQASKPAVQAPAQPPKRVLTMRAPLTATVSKTLYLPPAMYGQWSVTGNLMNTNVSDTYPVSNNIWLLERVGDEVIITNPENGASASINVTEADGNSATFLKRNSLGRVTVSETVTITVDGDRFSGQNLMKREYMKDGQVTKTQFALFHLNGVRLGGASAHFKPEREDAEPMFEIKDVQR